MRKILSLALLFGCLIASAQQISSSSVLRLELEGEYISVYDTVPDPDVRVLHEIASNIQFKWASGDPNSSNYNKLTLVHALDYERVRTPFIDKFSFDGSNILNSSNGTYDRSGLETFLSTNTGFSWAGIAAASSTLEFAYVPFPEYLPPLNTDTVDLGTTGDIITSGEISSSNVEIIGDWAENFYLSGISNTLSNEHKWFWNGHTIGDDASSAGNLAMTGSSNNGVSNHTYINGFITGNSNQAGGYTVRGTAASANTSGAIHRWLGITSYNMSWANFQANDFTAQSSEYFEKLEWRFCIADSYGFPGGEGWYIGLTTKTPGDYPIIRNGRLVHVAAVNQAREGLQFNGIVPANDGDYGLWVTNATVYNTGRKNTDPHLYSLQAQNVNGLVEYSIFDKSTSVAILAVHDFKIRHSFFNYDGTDTEGNTVNAQPQIRIQKLTANYSPAEAGNNGDVLFDTVYFKIPNASSYTTQSPIRIAEDEANIVFNRPVFLVDSASLVYEPSAGFLNGLIEDARTDKVTYSITINNPIVASYDSIPAPSYATSTTDTTFSESDRSTVGVVTSQWHYDYGMGFRNPNGPFIESEVEFENIVISDTELRSEIRTTDTTGTVYVVLTGSTTKPSAAQVKAGQDHTGAAAAYNTSFTTFTDPTTEVNATGLTADSLYYFYAVHTTTQDSRVWKSDSVRTDATPEPTYALFNISRTTTATGDPNGYTWNDVLSGGSSVPIQQYISDATDRTGLISTGWTFELTSVDGNNPSAANSGGESLAQYAYSSYAPGWQQNDNTLTDGFTCTLGGLDNSKTYDLTFFCSSSGADNGSRVEILVNGVQEITGYDIFTPSTQTASGISPSGGEINFKIQLSALGNTRSFRVLEVKENP